MLLTSNTRESLNKLTDQQVWNQLREGDHQALEYLYRAYGKDLFNFGMKLYGRHEWVKDTLQELFVDIWKQHKTLSAVSSVKTYLLTSLKFKLHRQHGKEKRWVYGGGHERLPQMEVELPLESQIVSEQLLMEKELKLVRAIQKLPARQREVLHLLFDAGLSYEEVAGFMEINVRSVYTLAWKAVSSLRKIIIHFILLFTGTHFFSFF